MIGKAAVYVLLLIILLGSLYFLYQNLPGEPEELSVSYSSNPELPEIKANSSISQFYPNMRFRNSRIFYFIDTKCNDVQEERIKRAFDSISQEVGVIQFQNNIESEAEIIAVCSKDYVQLEGNLIKPGEGGPTEIINTSKYNIILSGAIFMYGSLECEYPIVEVHEIMHVLGFDHINESMDIMYPYSSCEQRISAKEISILRELYSVESLPDLSFSNVSAVKKGRYLDFSLEIKNIGLDDANGVILSVLDSDKVIKEFDIGEVGIVQGKSLLVENLKLSSRDTEGIVFEIKGNKQELNEENNILTLSI